jgi:hypothetical protein
MAIEKRIISNPVLIKQLTKYKIILEIKHRALKKLRDTL